MKKQLIFLLMFSYQAHAGWSVFHNRPKNDKEFVGACMDTGGFAKFSSALLDSDSCKLDLENTHSINCKDEQGSSTSTWFESQEECNKFRHSLSGTSEKQANMKAPGKSGWSFFKLKSSQLLERFKPCEKVNSDFEGYIKQESDMWSSRGAICKASSFYGDKVNVFECKYPNLGDTIRYYFWHESKEKCEARQKIVKEKWNKEKLD